MSEGGAAVVPLTISVGGKKKYAVKQMLGRGGFGDVHLAREALSGAAVAIKFERKRTENLRSANVMEREIEVLSQLAGTPGFPAFIHAGTSGSLRFLVLTLLGPSLEAVMQNLPGKRFSENYVLSIGYLALGLLQSVHSAGFAYCDVKPHNFLIPHPDHLKDSPDQLYLVDFGGAMYMGEKRAPKRGLTLLGGTARYASIGAHQGLPPDPADDLESLSYMLVYLARGSLPWSGIRAANSKERNRLIGLKKCHMTAQKLCKGCSRNLCTFVDAAKRLARGALPGYSQMQKLLLEEDGGALDLDWMDTFPAESSIFERFMCEPIESAPKCTMVKRAGSKGKLRRRKQPAARYAVKKEKEHHSSLTKKKKNPSDQHIQNNQCGSSQPSGACFVL